MIDVELTAHRETALLVGVILSGKNSWEEEDHLDELEELAITANAKILGRVVQERAKIEPRYFLGKGKIEEIAEFVSNNKVGVVIFDDDLSPAQLRNLENIIQTKIVDRSTLILDIFASHARTNEAKTQVELAQLQYFLPRLTRQWTHLSRQVGGIGTKGPGETQLETDRRIIRNRIQKLKGDLEKIELQRSVRRKGRENYFKVALVGYTNVGKSTIMRMLTNADIFVKNSLFATLDSTIRKVYLDFGKEILLSDTVGFIRKLPHHLIASFRSTLEETAEADLLLHVVDISHPNFEEQIKVVNEVLHDLKINTKNIVIIFNKIDLIEQEGIFPQLKRRYQDAVFISAVKNMGVSGLKNKIIDFFDKDYENIKIILAINELQHRQTILKHGLILEERLIEDNKTEYKCRIPKAKFKKMLKENKEFNKLIIDDE